MQDHPAVVRAIFTSSPRSVSTPISTAGAITSIPWFPVTITEAALGAKIEVPTLDGRAALKVPPGTQSGQNFRLRGKGAPSLRSKQRGDHYVEVQVKVPRAADERTRELLRELGQLHPENSRRGMNTKT